MGSCTSLYDRLWKPPRTLEDHTEDRQKHDDRTVMHDSVIHSLDELAAYTKEHGKEAKWRDELGYQRKRIGDFACYVFFDLWSICKVKYDESVKSKFCQIKRSVRRTL